MVASAATLLAAVPPPSIRNTFLNEHNAGNTSPTRVYHLLSGKQCSPRWIPVAKSVLKLRERPDSSAKNTLPHTVSLCGGYLLFKGGQQHLDGTMCSITNYRLKRYQSHCIPCTSKRNTCTEKQISRHLRCRRVSYKNMAIKSKLEAVTSRTWSRKLTA